MSRDLRGGLRSRSRLAGRAQENPMDSIANLADVMLVFACGLMMALVTFWNIDVSRFSELEETRMEAIDNPEQLPEELASAGSSYVERGTVYQDPRTGKYYLLTQDLQQMDDDLAATDTPAATGAVAAPDRASGAD